MCITFLIYFVYVVTPISKVKIGFEITEKNINERTGSLEKNVRKKKNNRQYSVFSYIFSKGGGGGCAMVNKIIFNFGLKSLYFYHAPYNRSAYIIKLRCQCVYFGS